MSAQPHRQPDTLLAAAPAPTLRAARDSAGARPFTAWRNAAAPAAASERPRVRRLGLGESIRYGWLLGPLLLLAYWIIGSATGWIDSRVLPAPWVAVTTGWDLIQQGRLQAHLGISALRAGEGLLAGVLIGLAMALASGLSLLGGYLFDGLVQLKRSVPSLALLPFFILWFGIGEFMKVAVITLGVFTPIYLHTHNALRGIDLRYVELAETLRLSRAEFIRHVVLPGAMPGFFLGLRFALLGAWLGLVVVESVNATSGIGYMVNLARNYAQTDIMLVGLVLYGVLGLASDYGVRWLERKVLVWRRTLAK